MRLKKSTPPTRYVRLSPPPKNKLANGQPTRYVDPPSVPGRSCAHAPLASALEEVAVAQRVPPDGPRPRDLRDRDRDLLPAGDGPGAPQRQRLPVEGLRGVGAAGVVRRGRLEVEAAADLAAQRSVRDGKNLTFAVKLSRSKKYPAGIARFKAKLGLPAGGMNITASKMVHIRSTHERFDGNPAGVYGCNVFVQPGGIATMRRATRAFS